MGSETDRAKVEAFMAALAGAVRGAGRVYITGGGTAVLYGWRAATIDLDLKADPEPPGFFEAIAELKESIDLNVELASRDQFIPPLPAWRDRSVFIARHGPVEFYHYDLYSQALAKLERGHARDLEDVSAMVDRELISRAKLRELFVEIQPQLFRYPAIEGAAFESAVLAFAGVASHD